MALYKRMGQQLWDVVCLMWYKVLNKVLWVWRRKLSRSILKKERKRNSNKYPTFFFFFFFTPMSSTSTWSWKVMRSCPKPASIVITNTPRWDSCPSRGVQVLRKFYFCQPKTTKYQTKSKRRRLFVRRGGIRQSPTHTHTYTLWLMAWTSEMTSITDAEGVHGTVRKKKKLLDSCDYYCRPVGLSHLSPCQRISTDQRCSLSSHAVKHCDFQLIWLCLLSQITTFIFFFFDFF